MNNKSTKKNKKDSKNISLKSIKNSKVSTAKKNKSLKVKDMNFIDRYEIIVEAKPPKINPKYFILPSGVVLSILLIIIIAMSTILAITNTSNKHKNEYINSEDNIAKYSQAEKLTQEITKRRNSKNQIESVINSIDKYPNLNNELINIIFGTAGQNKCQINDMDYNSEQGLITINCNTKSEKNVPIFVCALNNTKKFNLVTYVGYNGNAEEGYTFTVSCVCKGN